MNEHPKVSIVVPAYNAAGYVEGCINSVLAQSCGSFELIIVNDGSKDGTAAVVSAMAEKDARVRLSVSYTHLKANEIFAFFLGHDGYLDLLTEAGLGYGAVTLG